VWQLWLHLQWFFKRKERAGNNMHMDSTFLRTPLLVLMKYIDESLVLLHSFASRLIVERHSFHLFIAGIQDPVGDSNVN
jgi:hypothetical protein